MKQLISLLYFFALATACLGQSNLVQNGSFEQGDRPWNYEVVSIAPPWDSFYTSASTNCIFNGEAPPGPCVLDESSQSGSEHPSTVPENIFGYQQAHSGQRYVALNAGSCWLEVQGIKVPLDEPVSREDIVELQLYVSQADNYQPIGFSVRLSEDDNWSNNDSTDPLIYSGDANNSTNWVEHFREFRLKDLECCDDSDECCAQYNWLLIKVNPNFSSSGMFIDDVSLRKTYDCYVEHDCVPRAGPSNLLFSMPHNADFPFCAIGAENLSYIKMEIWSGNGSELIWEFEMDFPPNRICWDGRNAIGYTVANATYEYRVYTESFCNCSREYTDHFLKFTNAPLDPSYEYYDDYYFNMPENGCPRPGLCCGDITQSLNVFGCDMDGQREYKVQNEIHVEDAMVKENADVSMWAGNRIVLSNFSTEADSKFVAEIVPCPNLRLGFEETYVEVTEPDLQNPINRILEQVLSVYPNPNSGSFTISANEIGAVHISDVSGKKIKTINGGFRSKLEVNGLSSGLYIIRVQMADGSVENAKVVVN